MSLQSGWLAGERKKAGLVIVTSRLRQMRSLDG